MRWSLLLPVVIGLSIAAGRLLSQETSTAERDDALQRPASLLRHTTAVHFQIVLGRLQLDPVRYRKGTHHRQSPHRGASPVLTESLAINAQQGRPCLHYGRQTPECQLTLDVNELGKLHLESTAANGSSRLVLIQETGQPIKLRRFEGRFCEEHSFSTWFDLCVAVPDLYRQHLEPLVDDLLYPIRLCELVSQAHQRSIGDLLATHSSAAAPGAGLPAQPLPPQIDNQTLDHWIASLGSSRRAQRVEALCRLHQQGISLLPRLSQIDKRSLDAEQRERLIHLIGQLTPRSDDHVARVAMLIRDDAEYWTAAAGQLSADQHSLVTARLERLRSPASAQVASAATADTPYRR
jgi:hypothetical protein